MAQVDRPLAKELYLFADANVDLQPFYDNAIRKLRKGVYSHSKGHKLFRHAADRAARAYAKDSGMTFASINVPTRNASAEMLQRDFEAKHGDEGPIGNPTRRRNPMYVIRSTSTGRELATVMASDSTQARKKARDYGLGNDISVQQKNPAVSGVKFTLKKVPLDSGGYTKGRSGGRYFGVGLPLYYYEDYETGDISGFLRATGKQDAVEQLRKAVQYKI